MYQSSSAPQFDYHSPHAQKELDRPSVQGTRLFIDDRCTAPLPDGHHVPHNVWYRFGASCEQAQVWSSAQSWYVSTPVVVTLPLSGSGRRDVVRAIDIARRGPNPLETPPA